MRFARLAPILALLLTPGAFAQGEVDPCTKTPVDAGSPPPVAAPATPRLKVGLALGSGSMHGLAHIGVLQELEARGLDVQVVAGTSIGAVIGGLWASGYSARAIEEMSRGSDWEDVGGFAISWQGLFSNEGMRRQLEKLFGGRPIESWPRTFGAVATDVTTGTRRVLARGDAAAAIQASTAVPVLFTPVHIDAERLVDGALVEPVPVAAARSLGADFVIAVDVAYRPYEEAASGLTAFAFQAMHILVNSLAAQQLRDADYSLRLDLHHQLMRCGSHSLIEVGRAAVRDTWPALVVNLRAAAARSAANARADLRIPGPLR